MQYTFILLLNLAFNKKVLINDNSSSKENLKCMGGYIKVSYNNTEK